MRLLLVVTDPGAVGPIERGLMGRGQTGFTVIPQAWGSGRTGLHTGDRVHPGGTSVLFTVVPDAAAPGALSAIREARDAAGARDLTRIFSLPAEEVSAE